MTNPNYAHILMVIDRSGSMAKTKDDADGGIRTFIEEQRKVVREDNVKITVSIAEFDDKFDWVQVFEPVEDVGYEITPRGMTALLDAVGRAVTEEGERLAKMAEDERPDRVAVRVVTDGYENASKEWTWARVQALLDHQRDTYGWQIQFQASDLTTAAKTRGMGYQTTVYADTGEGTQAVYAAAATQTAKWSSGKSRTIDMPDEV